MPSKCQQRTFLVRVDPEAPSQRLALLKQNSPIVFQSIRRDELFRGFMLAWVCSAGANVCETRGVPAICRAGD